VRRLGAFTMIVGIGIGSNLGNKHNHVSQALVQLSKLNPQMIVSSIYETDPIDCPHGSDTFLNLVVELDWDGMPSPFLKKLQQIELQMGRPTVRIKNQPRVIDMDLLFAGDCVDESKACTIPHPRMLERVFVLEPLMEIDSDRILPHTGKMVKQHLAELKLQENYKPCRKI
jgi:2-amino-4-hydroxy-6-hydroxymethyldihydropteridine diphosphokinase